MNLLEWHAKGVLAEAGLRVPRGTPLGHAGAMISSAGGERGAKVAALRAAGVHVTASPAELAARAVTLAQRGAAG